MLDAVAFPRTCRHSFPGGDPDGVVMRVQKRKGSSARPPVRVRKRKPRIPSLSVDRARLKKKYQETAARGFHGNISDFLRAAANTLVVQLAENEKEARARSHGVLAQPWQACSTKGRRGRPRRQLSFVGFSQPIGSNSENRDQEPPRHLRSSCRVSARSVCD